MGHLRTAKMQGLRDFLRFYRRGREGAGFRGLVGLMFGATATLYRIPTDNGMADTILGMEVGMGPDDRCLWAPKGGARERRNRSLETGPGIDFTVICGLL
jgi:hypothetical protein